MHIAYFLAVAIGLLVVLYSRKEEPISKWRTFGKEQLFFPQGLASSPSGEIIVTDTYHHRMVVFTHEGNLSHTWGGRGEGAGEFDHPSGVAVLPSGEIIITDTYNHRVHAPSAACSARKSSQLMEPFYVCGENVGEVRVNLIPRMG